MYGTFGIDEMVDEPHYHKHIRNIAINWACQAHLEQCLNDTRTKLDSFLKGESLSPNHEPAILCNGLREASDVDYEAMMDKFSNTTDSRLRELYIRSMGCIENEEILTIFISAIYENQNNEFNNEWQTALDAMYSNGPIGIRVALKFLRDRYVEIMKM